MRYRVKTGGYNLQIKPTYHLAHINNQTLGTEPFPIWQFCVRAHTTVNIQRGKMSEKQVQLKKKGYTNQYCRYPYSHKHREILLTCMPYGHY